MLCLSCSLQHPMLELLSALVTNAKLCIRTQLEAVTVKAKFAISY